MGSIAFRNISVNAASNQSHKIILFSKYAFASGHKPISRKHFALQKYIKAAPAPGRRPLIFQPILYIISVTPVELSKPYPSMGTIERQSPEFASNTA